MKFDLRCAVCRACWENTPHILMGQRNNICLFRTPAVQRVQQGKLLEARVNRHSWRPIDNKHMDYVNSFTSYFNCSDKHFCVANLQCNRNCALLSILCCECRFFSAFKVKWILNAIFKLRGQRSKLNNHQTNKTIEQRCITPAESTDPSYFNY